MTPRAPRKHKALQHVWSHLEHHVSGWVIGGILLTLTGFTPEDVIKSLFETLGLQPVSFDIRIALLFLGVAIVVVQVLRHPNRGRLKTGEQTPASGASPIGPPPRRSRSRRETPAPYALVKYRILPGLAALLVLIAVPALYLFRQSSPPPVTVAGYLGGSKANLLNEPEVIAILRDKYGLKVEYSAVGGHEVGCSPQEPQDFLWPGSELAVESLKVCSKRKLKYDSILLSPLVIYSSRAVTDALIRQGLIKQTNGYYSIEMNQFVPLLLARKIALPTQIGGQNYVYVRTSDPGQSDSGEIFAAMLAAIVQRQSGVRFDQTFPDVKLYFDSIGFKHARTIDLFKECIGEGVQACPMFVGYESLFADYSNQFGVNCDELKSVRVIYPDPTVWATHPFIAVTPNGERLLAALRDSRVQEIAVEKHGFRSASGRTPQKGCFPVPSSLNSMPLPSKSDVDDLIIYLGRKK